MANRQPSGDLRGIVVPDYVFNGATITATSQAGPKPGAFVPQQATSMALDSSGTLDLAVDDIEVTTQEAGGVGTGTFRWNHDGENPRSWDPPVLVSGWELIERSTTAGKYTRFHVVRQPSTGLALLSATDATNTVVCYRQDRFGKWSSATVKDTGAATVSCLVPLANGRLVCLYTLSVASSATQVGMSYSDDGGATWAVGSAGCLRTPLAKASSAYLRIRGAELNGQICVVLFEQDTTDKIYQYASKDGGGSLTTIETFSSANKGWPDLVAHNGALYFASIDYVSGRTNSELVPLVRRITSASMKLSSAEGVDAAPTSSGTTEWAERTGSILTSGECALLADDDGALWLYGVDFDASSSKEAVTRFSRDGGATWEANGLGSHTPSGTVLYTGDSSTYLVDLAVAPERGRAILVHRAVVQAAHDDSIMAMYLGGWTTVGMPAHSDLLLRAEVAGWDHLWLGMEQPENHGWTASGATGTAILGASGLTVTATAGQQQYYEKAVTLTSPAEQGILAEFHVTVGATGEVTHELRISDGTNDYTVRATVDATGITLRDMNGSTDLTTVPVDSIEDGIVLRIALDKPSGAWSGNNGRVRAWYRVDGPFVGALVNYGPRGDREWAPIQTIPGGVTVWNNITAGVATTSRVLYGAVDPGSATYRYAAHSAGLYTAGNIADSVTGHARGRTIPAVSTPAHIVSGLRLAGKSGATVGGDSWTWRTAFEYPVEAIDPSRKGSPRRKHRNLSSAVDHVITWDADLPWRIGDYLFVGIVGANWRTAVLARNGTTILNIDLAHGRTGLAYEQAQALVQPDSGGANLGWISERSLVGASVDFGSGVVRRVRTNRSGGWYETGVPGNDYPPATIILEDSTSVPASGTLDLWMPSGGFLVTHEAIADAGNITLTIPAQDTAEGYFELGKVILGRVRFLPWQWSRGRSVGFTPNYSLSTTRSGARRGRTLGPARPHVEIAWSEGVDTTGIFSPETVPDYIKVGPDLPDAVGAWPDTPRLLSGVFQEAGGAVLPGALLPAIPQVSGFDIPSSDNPIRLLDPEAVLYGRFVTESLVLEAAPNVHGDELRDPGEVLRFSARFDLEV